MHKNKVKTKTDEKIEQLRHKIIFVAIVVLLCMFTCVVLFTNMIIDIYNNKEADANIHKITSAVMLDTNLNIASPISFFVIEDTPTAQSVNLNNAYKIDQQKALNMYELALKQGHTKGTLQQYRYGITEYDDTVIAVFMNISQYQETKNLTTGVLLVILLISFAILSIVTSICSNFIIEPFIESSEYQKQFITDASHDLKTPLSVIIANTDVIEISHGADKWTKNIKKEARHMAELIDDMLTLTKLDNFTDTTPNAAVNVSDMLNDMVSEFDAIWKERKINVVNKINPNIETIGNYQQIHRLFQTIMQNATKYTTEGGTFEITTQKQKHRIIVSMYNTANLDPDIDYNRLFERFYRGDSSRNSKTGGHGIGLAIAKKICELEHYQIQAEKQRDGIVFIITL